MTVAADTGGGWRAGGNQERNGAAGLEISKGAHSGEPCLAVFGGVVFQGEDKAGESWRQGNPALLDAPPGNFSNLRRVCLIEVLSEISPWR